MSFSVCSKIGDKGVNCLIGSSSLPVIPIGANNSTGLKLQKELGDCLINLNGLLIAIEVKTEIYNKYGNLFIEIYSNSKTNNLGWIISSSADILAYSFLEENLTYFLNMKELKKWGLIHKNFKRFPIKAQHKRNQKNLTLGRAIPIRVLSDELENFEVREMDKPLDLQRLFLQLNIKTEV